MINLVLYRKYRPKSWSEVIGQEHIVRTLTNSLKLRRIGHAYLFCGSRGTGKTTLARLFAKALNCLKINDFEPCNQCLPCTEINESRALDLIEIDAASNRGIDEIRELRDGIKFSPVSHQYKVFIIDEVHMLTKEAFNALLKTLEEPPAHAIFILATTEPQRLPQTILSRVQRFDFRKLNIPELLKKLQYIVKKEDINISDDALKLVAGSADGSSRDAESMLDQLRTAFPDGFDSETAQNFLGLVDIGKVKTFIDILIANNLTGAISFVKKLDQNGQDLSEFLKASLEYLRKILFLKVDASLIKTFSEELNDESLDIIQAQAQKFDLDKLSQTISIFMVALQDIKRSPIPSLPLEIALVDILNLKNKN